MLRSWDLKVGDMIRHNNWITNEYRKILAIGSGYIL